MSPTAAEKSDFLTLVGAFPPRPIRDNEQLVRVYNRVKSIVLAGELTPDEEDYVYLLNLTVAAYEKRAHPPGPLTDADLLQDLLDEAGMTQTQLAAEAGIADSTVSAILAGKEKIGKGHIAAFVRIFGVSPTEFLQD